jgi:hypothetical protein
VVPPDASSRVLKLSPDEKSFDNGGIPACDYAIGVRPVIESVFRLSVFAWVANHGLGQRCKDLRRPSLVTTAPITQLRYMDTGRVGIAAKIMGLRWMKTLPATARYHVSLFDGTLQGFGLDRQACVLLSGTLVSWNNDIAYLFDLSRSR